VQPLKKIKTYKLNKNLTRFNNVLKKSKKLNMTIMEFRLLKADEIDCRVQQVGKGYCTVLLYKDARCDMNILDEVVGSMNWQRNHTRDNANCIVSIWDSEKQQWISKEDTGVESNTEKEKGLASDSFKRACFNWGIGRELYTSPHVKIKLSDSEFSESNGKYKLNFISFSVSEIGYTDKKITSLKIIDNKGSVRYQLGKEQTAPPKPQPAPLTPEQQQLMNEYNELKAQITAEIIACKDAVDLQIIVDSYPQFAKIGSFKKMLTEKHESFK